MTGHHQQGAVLIIGLLILLMLGMIGTGSLNSVTSQERMISSIHDDSRARQGAEAALFGCEKLLDELSVSYDSNVMSELIHGDDDEDEATSGFDSDWWNDDSLWDSYGVSLEALSFSGEDQAASLAKEPRCYLQRVEQTDDKNAFHARFANVEDVMADRTGDAQRSGGVYHFRVTAESTGTGMRSDNLARTRVVLQSDYFKRLF